MSDILRASMRKATVRELDEYDECCRTCNGVSLVVVYLAIGIGRFAGAISNRVSRVPER